MPQRVINRLSLALGAALFATTLALYWPVIHADFITLDDRGYILLNPHVRTGLTWQNLGWAFTSYYGANWHPLTWISHMLDCQFFGINSGGHHFTSALLHAINTTLLFAVLQRLTGATWRSAVVAGLFGWHPLHVESVAWVAERKDVLSGFFFMLTLYAWTKAVGKCEGGSAKGEVQSSNFKLQSSNFSWFWYALTLVFYSLGLLSKPMLVTVPFVLLLLDVWPFKRAQGRRTWLRLLLEKLPFFALSAAACVLTFLAQRHAGAVASVASMPLANRIENALVSYAVYIGKIFWPTRLAVYYPYSGGWPAWKVIASAVLLLLLSAGASRQVARFRPYLFTGWFWFVGMLVPVIGLVQVGLQARADRYTYLPAIGLFIGIVWFVASVLPGEQKRKGATAAEHAQASAVETCEAYSPKAEVRGRGVVVFGVALLSVFVVFACCFQTRRQLEFWHDAETLYRHTLEVTGPNAVIHANLGTALMRKGDVKGAEQEFVTAVRIKPDYAEALSDLSLVLTMQGRNEEAVPNLEKAIAIMPDMQQPHYLLAGVLVGQGKTGEAITELRTALELNPDWPAALNDLAWLLATQPDEHLRNGADAVTLAERACRLTDFRQPLFLGTLAAAYAESGRFDAAIQTAERAQKLAATAGDRGLVERNEHLLEMYRQGKPYHGG